MAKITTSRQVQRDLNKVVNWVIQGDDHIVTRDGKPLGVIISLDTYSKIPDALKKLKATSPELLKYFPSIPGIEKPEPESRKATRKPNQEWEFARAFAVWRGDK